MPSYGEDPLFYLFIVIVTYLYVQKKQTHVKSASPKLDDDAVKSPSNQKAEKKSKPVILSLYYCRKICCI